MESFGETVTYTDFGIINLAFLPWVSKTPAPNQDIVNSSIPAAMFLLRDKEGGVIAFTVQESGIEALSNKQAPFGVFSSVELIDMYNFSFKV